MIHIRSAPFYTLTATVCNMDELVNMNEEVTHLTLGNSCMNDNSTTYLFFNALVYLKELVIGNDSCVNVNQLYLIDLPKLESVVIGENSFANENGLSNVDGHFYVEDCPKLRTLRIGGLSFSDYSMFVLEGVDALEVIEIGKFNESSNSFGYASLELKSVFIHEA